MMTKAKWLLGPGDMQQASNHLAPNGSKALGRSALYRNNKTSSHKLGCQESWEGTVNKWGFQGRGTIGSGGDGEAGETLPSETTSARLRPTTATSRECSLCCGIFKSRIPGFYIKPSFVVGSLL